MPTTPKAKTLRKPEGCYDCGSTIKGHHTPLCDFAKPKDKLDLPMKPGTQHWDRTEPNLELAQQQLAEFTASRAEARPRGRTHSSAKGLSTTTRQVLKAGENRRSVEKFQANPENWPTFNADINAALKIYKERFLAGQGLEPEDYDDDIVTHLLDMRDKFQSDDVLLLYVLDMTITGIRYGNW